MSKLTRMGRNETLIPGVLPSCPNMVTTPPVGQGVVGRELERSKVVGEDDISSDMTTRRFLKLGLISYGE
jgi:hypothetical protein